MDRAAAEEEESGINSRRRSRSISRICSISKRSDWFEQQKKKRVARAAAARKEWLEQQLEESGLISS